MLTRTPQMLSWPVVTQPALAHKIFRSPAFWGIGMRLCLMPLACHQDLLSYYWAAHEAVSHNQWSQVGALVGGLYRFFPTALLNVGWFWLVRPLLGGADQWPREWFPSGDVYAASEAAWRAFVSLPNIGWVLFLLKLPHLIGECLMIRWLAAAMQDMALRRRVARFLWLNPVSIFVLYVFGSVEIFVLMMLAASLAAMLKRRNALAAMLLGMSIPFRLFPLLFVPLFALTLGKTTVERWRLGLLACAPAAVWLGILAAHAPGALAFLAHYKSCNFLLSMHIPLHDQDAVYPFLTGYALIIGWAAATRQPAPWACLRACLASLCLLYAACFFHPQYFVWAVPLLALQAAVDPGLMSAYTVQMCCFAVYTFLWGRPLAGYLFAPMHPDFFMSLPSPAELLSPLCSTGKMVGIAHSMLAGASLWMIARLLRPAQRDI